MQQHSLICEKRAAQKYPASNFHLVSRKPHLRSQGESNPCFEPSPTTCLLGGGSAEGRRTTKWNTMHWKSGVNLRPSWISFVRAGHQQRRLPQQEEGETMKMKRIVILMAVFLISSIAQSRDLPGTETRAEIFALDNAWIKAEVGHDKAEPPGDPDSYKGRTIMAVFAHSDDERSVSPILAKYAKKGATVYLVLATDGSKGVEPHANIPAGEPLAKARAEEALCSTKAMGIEPPILLGFPDGELVAWDNIFSLDDRIEEVFTKYQPDVVITWGSDGGYGHPDHRMVSNIVTEVFQRVASRKIKQLLYVGWLKEELDSAPELKTEKGAWFRDNLKTSQKRFLTYRIEFGEDERRAGRKALECSASQFTPDVMDDLSVLVEHTRAIYFRPWHGSGKRKNDIFD